MPAADIGGQPQQQQQQLGQRELLRWASVTSGRQVKTLEDLRDGDCIARLVSARKSHRSILLARVFFLLEFSLLQQERISGVLMC